MTTESSACPAFAPYASFEPGLDESILRESIFRPEIYIFSIESFLFAWYESIEKEISISGQKIDSFKIESESPIPSLNTFFLDATRI